MVRGLWVGLILFSGVLVYTSAMEATGAVVLHPSARTVCVVSKEEEKETVTFPVDLEGTPLRAEGTVYYEGAFLESEQQEEPAMGVLALLVRNTGTEALESVRITLSGESGSYRFLGCHIPPDSRVLLLETGGAAWNRDEIYSIQAQVASEPPDLIAQGKLEIRDVDMGAVAVTNHTERTLQNLRLYYKTYLSDADLYQGGICYEEVLTRLEPGETVRLLPGRYAMGYSRFVRAEEE